MAVPRREPGNQTTLFYGRIGLRRRWRSRDHLVLPQPVMQLQCLGDDDRSSRQAEHLGLSRLRSNHHCAQLQVTSDRLPSGLYIYGQFMKFIQPGAVRIASSGSTHLPPNVALKNPHGCFVLVAADPRTEPRDPSIAWNGKFVTMSLAEKSAVTLTWRR